MEENLRLICRICLCPIEPLKATSINQRAEKLHFEDILLKDVIEKCISEMDLDISNDAVVCHSCYDTLVSIYIFKLKCFQTEERIYSYMEQNNLRLGDKVDLSNLLEISNPDAQEIVLISDSDSVQEVSFSECVNEDATIKQEDKIDIIYNNVDETTLQNNEGRFTSAFYSTEEYSCAKCEYKTYRKDRLERHVHFNCENRMYKYKCDTCPYESVRKMHLTRRRFSHGDNRPYICGVCDKGFKEKNNIRLHILYKHSGLLMPYKCGIEDCQESFERKCDYNLHIVKHVNYRPFMCQLCKKGFFNELQWDAHMAVAHGLYSF